MAAAADLAEMTLDAARFTSEQLTVLEAQKFQYALLWADLHPGDVVDTSVPWEERDLEVAGDGAPTVAEFAIADFALAVGMSTDAGRLYIGDAVETHYRLPRLWARLVAGEVPVWKARKIAQHTRSLPIDGAAHVDRHLAHHAHHCSYAQIERAVEHARALFDPEDTEARRAEQAEQRHFDIRLGDVTLDGLVHLDGTLDLADALTLEAQIAAKAHDLLATHPGVPLDVRRAIAAGHLGTDQTSGTSGTGREVVIHTHHHTTDPDGIIAVENTRSFVTVEQLAEWCQAAGTKVTIRPVLDLTQNLHTDTYTPTPRQREQAVLVNPTCVFPHCTRPSRGCDLDHIHAFEHGGPTSSDNLAPLCRAHHRLKTFAGWTYTRTSPQTFTWTTPTGHTHQTDHRRS